MGGVERGEHNLTVMGIVRVLQALNLIASGADGSMTTILTTRIARWVMFGQAVQGKTIGKLNILGYRGNASEKQLIPCLNLFRSKAVSNEKNIRCNYL
jgi:hypothetical protein